MAIAALDVSDLDKDGEVPYSQAHRGSESVEPEEPPAGDKRGVVYDKLLDDLDDLLRALIQPHEAFAKAALRWILGAFLQCSGEKWAVEQQPTLGQQQAITETMYDLASDGGRR